MNQEYIAAQMTMRITNMPITDTVDVWNLRYAMWKITNINITIGRYTNAAVTL
jgi:hypothetical protein